MNKDFTRRILYALALFNYAVPAGAATYIATILQPVGYAQTQSYGASGANQVGWGRLDSSPFETHGLLWSGTASTAIDLNPAGYSYSFGYGASGNSQVG